MNSTKPLVGVVGPCKSGKSTLVRGLLASGYQAQQIAQEHSFAPRMWELISRPEVLIFLDCDYETTVNRGLDWTRQEYKDQLPRLTHARQNADFSLVTNGKTEAEVLSEVLLFLAEHTSRR